MQVKWGLAFPDSDTHNCLSWFETEHFAYALQYLKQLRVAVDGGAHVGTWTRIMAQTFREVHAFEPSEENFDCLARNTANLTNVTRHRCALGAEMGRGALHEPVNPGNSGAAWVTEGEDFDVCPLDELGLTEVDFIKLDVEGYEPFALEGAAETIARDRPMVLFEEKEVTARYGRPVTAARELLERWGYMPIWQINKDAIFVPKDYFNG